MEYKESAIVFPILPGKRPDLDKFVQAIAVDWKAEHARIYRHIQSESWFLQATPQGDLLIVYIKATEPMDIFIEFALSEEPFAIWFRQSVLHLCGINLALMPPFNLPERILHCDREVIIRDK